MKRNLAALLILGFFCFLSCGERQTKLSNGKNLDGWTFHIASDSTTLASLVFCAREGLINISGQPFGYMMTEQSFADYKLHLEWRWYGEPTNSGIFLRSTKESAENPAGEWNTAEIICNGNFIQAYINGVLMNEAHFNRSSGPIALQSEGGPLEVRNVYIIPLKK